ncbi:MAG: Co2+/Mg2+ efflux protein ApaG [Ideonella sp.]|jgi:ApaG protein|nr:Co2+/Mg2+ efflux protein ApaG [Ideonella sp.]
MNTPRFTVSVAARHLPESSGGDEGGFAFAYTVTIRNDGAAAAQLVARHWIITDASGHVEEVRGLGVVGHQPLLQPGEAFEYTSGARLATPSGTMRGTYFCITDDARWFDTPIPEFVLATAASLH